MWSSYSNLTGVDRSHRVCVCVCVCVCVRAHAFIMNNSATNRRNTSKANAAHTVHTDTPSHSHRSNTSGSPRGASRGYRVGTRNRNTKERKEKEPARTCATKVSPLGPECVFNTDAHTVGAHSLTRYTQKTTHAIRSPTAAMSTFRWLATRLTAREGTSVSHGQEERERVTGGGGDNINETAFLLTPETRRGPEKTVPE